MHNFVLVAIGGALGSVARYGSQVLFTSRFPAHYHWGTFIVNFIGCLLIGIVYGLSIRSTLNEQTRLLLMTGLCGGFTTMSAFSHESISLLREDKLFPFFAYVIVTVTLCLLATFAGFRIAR